MGGLISHGTRLPDASEVVRIVMPEKYELVIVGAITGPNPVKPQKEWIQSVKDHVPREKIYWKKNIQKYL